MKAILMSIRPKWVAKILNGEKTIEIRKKFLKDYVGWVYIYCCKQRKNEIGCHINYEKVDGKVVARFWCDKVEKFDRIMIDFEREDLKQNACISQLELDNYIKDNIGYAIHITKLEIFEEPKSLSHFLIPSHKVQGIDRNGSDKIFTILKPLTRAPQSWCYVEI